EVGVDEVVAAQPLEERTAGPDGEAGEVLGQAHVVVRLIEDDPVVAGHVRPDEGFGAGGRAVVGDDQPEVPARLREDRFDRPGDHLCAVVDGDANADLWRRGPRHGGDPTEQGRRPSDLDGGAPVVASDVTGGAGSVRSSPATRRTVAGRGGPA